MINRYFLLSVLFSFIVTTSLAALKSNSDITYLNIGKSMKLFTEDSVLPNRIPTSCYIPKPRIDTLEVKPNGDVFVRIRIADNRTTAYYDFYENSVAPQNFLKRVDSDQDSVVLALNALNQERSLLIQAIDSCDTNTRINSEVFKTFIPFGALGTTCSGKYFLQWRSQYKPRQRINQYSILVDSTGNGYELVNDSLGLNDTSIYISNIVRNTNYKFKVIAYRNLNSQWNYDSYVNISSPLIYTSPPSLRNNTIVHAPQLRCTYVNDDGSVTLNWVPPKDTALNFSTYNIQYRKKGGVSWNEIADNSDDLLKHSDMTYRVSLPDSGAQQNPYEFNVTTFSGCSGNVPSASNSISSTFVNITPKPLDPDNRIEISWSPTGVDYGIFKNYQVYKNTNGNGYGNEFLTTAFTNAVTDLRDSLACFNDHFYHVTLLDTLFQSQGLRCLVRSNLASAKYQDFVPLQLNPIEYVSYDLQNGGLNIFWDKNKVKSAKYIRFISRKRNNSNMKVFESLTANYNYNLSSSQSFNQIFIPDSILDSKDTSVLVGAIVEDSCGNTTVDSTVSFHETINVNAGWLIKDSINKLSWNPYVGFNTNSNLEYDIYYSFSSLGPWLLAGSSGNNTSYEHKIPSGDKMYYYHVKAIGTSSIIPDSMELNSNIAFVYSPFVDTTISINEVSFRKELSLYPNPFKQNFRLYYSGTTELYFRVFDLLGNELKINVSKFNDYYLFQSEMLSNGIYFLFVNDGYRQECLKFVKGN